MSDSATSPPRAGERSRDDFGTHLRRWRKARGKSQLELALIAGYSQRHLSFVESGRAQPSRTTVVVLCEALGVPLAARNTLLLAAGYAPMYRERQLDDGELAPWLAQLELLLERHDPFPVLIVDDAWNLVRANVAALRFFAWLRHGALPSGGNVLRWCFDPAGLKQNFVDWPVAARQLLWRLQRDVIANPDNQELAKLVDELQRELPSDAMKDVLASLQAVPPILVTRFRRVRADGESSDAQRVDASFFSLLATIGTAQDVTLAGLHLETFLPADDATRELLEALARGEQPT